jgi:glutathione S-transferase
MRFTHWFYHNNALAAFLRMKQLVPWRYPEMKLYFSPLACSLAARIALYEAGAQASFEAIDAKTKLTASGRDFRKIHALGLVPVLELPNGEVLSENAAVLQYVARIHPEAQLAPTDPLALARLQQWLCFIGTELHKGLFMPLLSKHAGPDAKSYALGLAESRLSWVARHLQDQEFLLERFSVADAYLFTILNWSLATAVDLKPWPALLEYQVRLRKRPSVERAFKEELELYRLEQARLEKEDQRAALP